MSFFLGSIFGFAWCWLWYVHPRNKLLREWREWAEAYRDELRGRLTK